MALLKSDSEEYQRLAKDESDSYLMVIKAEPDKDIAKTLAIGYAADHGTITDIWTGERETDFVLTGPYGVWVRILTGDLDPNKAMMMRHQNGPSEYDGAQAQGQREPAATAQDGRRHHPLAGGAADDSDRVRG